MYLMNASSNIAQIWYVEYEGTKIILFGRGNVELHMHENCIFFHSTCPQCDMLCLLILKELLPALFLSTGTQSVIYFVLLTCYFNLHLLNEHSITTYVLLGYPIIVHFYPTIISVFLIHIIHF